MLKMAASREEVFVEFITHGGVVKATTIDSKTGIEASVVGPASAMRATLQAAAIRKLDYVMKKQQGS